MSFGGLASFNIAIFLLALGHLLTRRVAFLRDFNIPEPVSSGLLACVATAVLYAGFGIEISFTLAARDFLLLYFFAAIGLNSDIKTLRAGGVPLAVLVGLTVAYIFIQNGVGVGVASTLGLDPLVGVIGGSVSLLGGHGTSIAWAPVFSSEHGIANASEIGIACATMGLVVSSLMGGPIARFLIQRHHLEPATVQAPDIGLAHETDSKTTDITYYAMLSVLFWLNVCVALGEVLQGVLADMGAMLPHFVCSLFAGIFLTNTFPRLAPKLPWPARGPALALISDLALGVFLAMSLMSLQLWTIAALAGPILLILATQTLVAALYALFVIFPLMGRDYEAAVVSAGFSGISLGATPTAMANMTAVAKKYGQAHRAFIIVPLVSGFFVDIANALVISRFLNWFGS